MTVEVVEETPSTVYLVLLAPSAQRGQELSSQEMEAVGVLSTPLTVAQEDVQRRSHGERPQTEK